MATSVTYDNCIYAFCGVNKENITVDHVQVYNPATKHCSQLKKPMPRASTIMRAMLWETSVILLGCESITSMSTTLKHRSGTIENISRWTSITLRQSLTTPRSTSPVEGCAKRTVTTRSYGYVQMTWKVCRCWILLGQAGCLEATRYTTQTYPDIGLRLNITTHQHPT